MSDKREIVVIGTSTGGLGALKQITSQLPADFRAAILIVMHVGSQSSLLPELLAPYSALPVRHANDREPIIAGTILIAPPDHHLLVERKHVRLSRGPKENFSRPAIDPLFRSAALAYRGKAIAVVLTGNLDDGTVGLQAIKDNGGIAVVQDPTEADAPSMPLSAIEHVDVDHCVPLSTIGATLVRLVEEPIRHEHSAADPGWLGLEHRIVLTGESSVEDLSRIGVPSIFTCPECHGGLWEVKDATPQRFRCHTGHAFTARTLAAAQDRLAEEAIWAAVRALHEKESLLKRFAQSASDNRHMAAAEEHQAAALQAAQHAEVLRKLLTD